MMTRSICKSIFSIIIILLVVSSCRKSTISPVQISGIWIEAKGRTDTLVFGYDNLLELKKGRTTMKTTNLFPSYGAGLYIYNLKQDSITLKYLISNTHVSKKFPFKMYENKLYIGDFYQKYPGQSVLLTFERLN